MRLINIHERTILVGVAVLALLGGGAAAGAAIAGGRWTATSRPSRPSIRPRPTLNSAASSATRLTLSRLQGPAMAQQEAKMISDTRTGTLPAGKVPGQWRRLGDLNPGWARTQTALAVRRHRPD